VFVAFLGNLAHVRDLSSGVIMAAVFLAEALVLKGVDVGVVYLLSQYEFVKGVGHVWWASK
jgi:hypothetical protein